MIYGGGGGIPSPLPPPHLVEVSGNNSLFVSCKYILKASISQAEAENSCVSHCDVPCHKAFVIINSCKGDLNVFN